MPSILSFKPPLCWLSKCKSGILHHNSLLLTTGRYVFATFQHELTDLADNDKGSPTTTIPTFLALYIFAFVYQLVLVWDALQAKNTIQIIGLVGLNIGLLIYGAVQIEQLHDAVTALGDEINADAWGNVNPILIAIPCIIALFTVSMAMIARKLYNEFAWTIYKHISADLRMKRRYLTYQIYVALLKFDFFFFLGFTIQFVVIVRRSNVERWLTVAAIPVTILIMLAAFVLLRRENLIGTILVIFIYFCGLAYFIFKLFRMYMKNTEGPYIPARKELTAFAALTILLLLMTITVACVCAHNYGKGLMPYIRGGKGAANDDKTYSHSSVAYGQSAYTTEMINDPYAVKMGAGRNTNRMEID